MTSEILQEYSRLCDEVESFMQQENAELRMGQSDGSDWVDNKKGLMTKFDHLLGLLRKENMAAAETPGPIQTLRDHVMKKLLKLLLLSRESEQLLLKNTLPQRPVANRVAVSARALRSAYQPLAS